MAFLYKILAYLGLMSFAAAIFYGFRYDNMAASSNLYFNIEIYGAFILIHLISTMPAFKKAIFGKPEGSVNERKIFILVTIITWWLLLWYHKPVDGFELNLPEWISFFGYAIGLYGFFVFFEHMDHNAINKFLGAHKTEHSHSVGAETPLMVEGSYSKVRHPMYTGAVILGTGGLLIHPNMGQLVFTALIGITFILFIPIEERMLIKARGDEYLEYKKKVPYRLIPGIW